jgi:predicted dehydrogenase
VALRVGIIGLGSVGEVHLEAGQQASGITITAGAEVDAARLQQLADRFGFTPYANYMDMLERERLDIVCVATPALSHEEITIRCAERGVHVLCEKPLTLSLDSADRMINACDKAGIKLAYGSTYRYLHPVSTAREIIARGEIGEVVLLRESYVSGTGPGNWKSMGFHHYPQGTPGGSGMGLVDHGIHMLDIFPWLAGDRIVAIQGRGNLSGAAPQTEYAIMQMSRGATGVVVYNDATWSTSLPDEGVFSWGGAFDKDGYHPPGSWHPEPGSMHVHGTRGALRIYHYAHRLYKVTASGPEQIVLPAGSSPMHFTRQLERFAQAVTGNQAVDVPAEAGREALRWLLAVYQ